MTKKLVQALKRQKKQSKQEVLQLAGSLGIPMGGQKRVEVPNRNSFVYVRLRDNQNEVIQAFNNKVAASYGLPIIVERQGSRYTVVGVDTLRYQNNWNSYSPYLARHGNTHSFSTENGGGGDIVWTYIRQFMPALIMPSGSTGGPNAILNAYTLKNSDGTWKYIGVTGTPSFLPYKPTGTLAVMTLVYLDSQSGNPYLTVGSSYFSASITGSAQIVPYIPTLSDPNAIPLAAVRLVSGTSFIGWDNIYDARQFIHTTPTGTGGGGLGSNEIYIDQSGGTGDTYGVLSGLVNGSNTLYTVSKSAYISGSLKVYLNGQLQTQGSGEDWVETNPAAGTFTFNVAPLSGDLITASYMRSATASGNADTVDGYHASSFLTSTVITTTVNRTLLTTDQILLCNNPSGTLVTLYPTSGTGRVHNIKSISNGTVTISGSYPDTIDGYSAKIINTIYDSVTIVDGGTGTWFIL
jgi:hypothetical protein